MNEPTQDRFFFDWQHVQRGLMEMTLDPDRITPEGRETIDRNKHRWNIQLQETGHGLRACKMPFGVRITPERPAKSAPWLETDRPWEEGVEGEQTVIQEDGKYRCWYRIRLTQDAAREMFPQLVEAEPNRIQRVRAYAESTDGQHWVKPELDVFRYQAKPTNVVDAAHSSAVMRDPSAPPEERYKTFSFEQLPAGGKPSHGLYGHVSPDGYHWNALPEPLIRYFHDTQNVPAWDPLLERYVAYLRDHCGGRSIGRSETDDFRNWPPHRTIFHPGPEDEASEDYYTNCFTTYPGMPSLRLMFPAIFDHLDDSTYIRLAVSRDNYRWNWVSREPIIKASTPPQWDSGNIWAAPNLVRLPDGRLALPIHSSLSTHTNYSAFYADCPEERAKIAWATWDDGRLAGIEAEEIGEFYTGNEKGNRLPIEINARTTAGGAVEAELHEPIGWGTQPIPGYSFDDCDSFTGDALDHPLSWNGRSNLEELSDRSFMIRFRLRRAKLFAYRIRAGSEDSAAEERTMVD